MYRKIETLPSTQTNTTTTKKYIYSYLGSYEMQEWEYQCQFHMCRLGKELVWWGT